MFVSFCLENTRQCLGISTGNNKGPDDFLGLQGKGVNVSLAQKTWIFDEQHRLHPLLFPSAYVTVDSSDFLKISYNRGTAVEFTMDPYFSVANGSLCVTPMQCQPDAMGFCNPNSKKRAWTFRRGQYIKLLPCLKRSPKWAIQNNNTEYEDTPTTSPIVRPTTNPISPTSLPRSELPSSAPTVLFPTASPLTFSPTLVNATMAPHKKNTSSPVTLKPSKQFVSTSPTLAPSYAYEIPAPSKDLYGFLAIPIFILIMGLILFAMRKLK